MRGNARTSGWRTGDGLPTVYRPREDHSLVASRRRRAASGAELSKNGPLDIEDMQSQVRLFADERDWHQFHNPKNLAAALAVEAAELLEIFQWLTPEEAAGIAQSEPGRARVGEEIADVMAYVLRLADVVGIDLGAAFSSKMIQNAEKYPVEASRGSAARPKPDRSLMR